MTTEKLGVGGKPAQPDDDGANAKPSRGGIDPILQGSLGKRLRDAYQEVVNEDVPDKFLDLLNQLKKRESGGGDTQP